ncbi:hypothetical protein ACFYSH_24130 [Streptomyces sp. NPDC005791]
MRLLADVQAQEDAHQRSWDSALDYLTPAEFEQQLITSRNLSLPA